MRAGGCAPTWARGFQASGDPRSVMGDGHGHGDGRGRGWAVQRPATSDGRAGDLAPCTLHLGGRDPHPVTPRRLRRRPPPHPHLLCYTFPSAEENSSARSRLTRWPRSRCGAPTARSCPASRCCAMRCLPRSRPHLMGPAFSISTWRWIPTSSISCDTIRTGSSPPLKATRPSVSRPATSDLGSAFCRRCV